MEKNLEEILSQFLKKYDAAVESYKKALKLNPKLKEIIDLKLKIMKN